MYIRMPKININAKAPKNYIHESIYSVHFHKCHNEVLKLIMGQTQ